MNLDAYFDRKYRGNNAILLSAVAPQMITLLLISGMNSTLQVWGWYVMAARLWDRVLLFGKRDMPPTLEHYILRQRRLL